jgi:GNAT superfamily N-acetyltransferase
MTGIVLREIDPKKDMPTLAEWFTILERQVNTVPGLLKYYDENKGNLFSQVAVNEQGDLIGFYWGSRNRFHPQKAFQYLFVDPLSRNKGLGSRLYQLMEDELVKGGCREFNCYVPDDCPEGLSFMLHRGFVQTLHSISMELDLASFDDKPYQVILADLEKQGFLFTTMAELGNTEDAQQKLYLLNDTTVMDTPLWRGGHCWETFEEFKKTVCDEDWYIPAGQNVVIDTSTGEWVGMSAITRFEGNETAYNLFTGVDKRYRGRKIAQTVKVKALRFARDVLKVPAARTNHNTSNDPMIAIDRKLGYKITPGYFAMEKKL